jgi:hypothetical protein
VAIARFSAARRQKIDFPQNLLPLDKSINRKRTAAIPEKATSARRTL